MFKIIEGWNNERILTSILGDIGKDKDGAIQSAAPNGSIQGVILLILHFHYYKAQTGSVQHIAWRC